jgi:hypothetical protein
VPGDNVDLAQRLILTNTVRISTNSIPNGCSETQLFRSVNLKVDIRRSFLTLKVWRLRLGATTTDDYIRCSPNQLQKPQLEQFGTTALLGGTLGCSGYPQSQRETKTSSVMNDRTI